MYLDDIAENCLDEIRTSTRCQDMTVQRCQITLQWRRQRHNGWQISRARKSADWTRSQCAVNMPSHSGGYGCHNGSQHEQHCHLWEGVVFASKVLTAAFNTHSSDPLVAFTVYIMLMRIYRNMDIDYQYRSTLQNGLTRSLALTIPYKWPYIS